MWCPRVSRMVDVNWSMTISLLLTRSTFILPTSARSNSFAALVLAVVRSVVVEVALLYLEVRSCIASSHSA